MALILAAHGTRSPGGVAMIEGLAAQVSTLAYRPVEVAFVDVLGPPPARCWSGRRLRAGPPSWCQRSCRADITSAPTCPPMSRSVDTLMCSSPQLWGQAVRLPGSSVISW